MAQSVVKWLTDIVGLPQYVDNFILNGFDKLEFVDFNDQETLNKIGIEPTGHVFRILKCIKTLVKSTTASATATGETNSLSKPPPPPPPPPVSKKSTTDSKNEKKLRNSRFLSNMKGTVHEPIITDQQGTVKAHCTDCRKDKSWIKRYKVKSDEPGKYKEKWKFDQNLFYLHYQTKSHQHIGKFFDAEACEIDWDKKPPLLKATTKAERKEENKQVEKSKAKKRYNKHPQQTVANQIESERAAKEEASIEAHNDILEPDISEHFLQESDIDDNATDNGGSCMIFSLPSHLPHYEPNEDFDNEAFTLSQSWISQVSDFEDPDEECDKILQKKESEKKKTHKRKSKNKKHKGKEEKKKHKGKKNKHKRKRNGTETSKMDGDYENEPKRKKRKLLKNTNNKSGYATRSKTAQQAMEEVEANEHNCGRSLTRYSQPQHPCVCDKCSKEIYGICFGCSECDYDLCSKCMHVKLI
eukprot:390715_1